MPEHRPFILLIDDDEDDLEMLSSLLKRSDIRIKTFTSGEWAIFYLHLHPGSSNRPSLIILDYNMPGLNGEQVLALIKGNEDTKHIPVVIYSTDKTLAYKKSLNQLGAFKSVTKPFTYSELTLQAELFKDLVFSFVPGKSLPETADFCAHSDSCLAHT